jgi:hypothetical protein
MQLLFGKGIKPGFQNAFIAVDLQLQDFANITHGLRTLTARACRTSQRPQRICLALQTNARATKPIAKGCTLRGG